MNKRKIKLIVIFSLNLFLGVVLASIFFYAEQQKNKPFEAYGKDRGPIKTLSDKNLSSLSLQQSLNTIAERNFPAVVSIRVTKTTTSGKNSQKFENELLRRFFGMPPNNRSYAQEAFGSGFVISEDGYVISNSHVVESASKIIVTFKNNKKEYEAILVGTDSDSDIALIKIKNAKNLPYVKLANSDKVKVGDIVVAIGNPFGFSHTFTMGVISAKGRRGISDLKYQDFIQTDVAINPGNSGGPLINLNGEVIGINSVIYSGQQNVNIGLGFAIPVNMAKNIANQLKTSGRVKRGWIGVGIQSLDNETAAALGIKQTGGVYIQSVLKGAPADKSGLQAGDVVVKYNGKSISDVNEFINQIGNTKPKSKITMIIVRKRKTMNIEIIIGEQKSNDKNGDNQNAPPKEQYSSKNSYLNIEVASINSTIQKQYQLTDRRGVVITYIGRKSPLAGKVNVGDIVHQINQNRVLTVSDYQKLMKKSKSHNKVLLHIKRDNALIPILVQMK